MELKEYLQILKKHLNLYLFVIFLIVVGSTGFFFFQPVSYETALLINVTREGIQETPAYRFDDFYRLQADERFSDTLAEWIRNPRIVDDIFSQAKINLKETSLGKIAKTFSVERRSSQIVSVRFSLKDQEVGEKISASLVKVISEKTQKLNEQQKESNWFRIVAEKPLTVKKSPDYIRIFAISLLGGIFAGFFVVMGKHYWE